MQRRRALALSLGGITSLGFALVAGCSLPPECTPQMTAEQCAEAVARAQAERLAKQAAEEARRRADEAVAEGQRRTGEAVADGQKRAEELWRDLWSGAPKPETRPADPARKDAPPAAFLLTGSPVPLDKVTFFAWYGATTLAHGDLRPDYQALQGLHSGIDFVVPVKTPITNRFNRPGKVLGISNTVAAFDYKAGPENVVVDYGNYLVVYGHTDPSELPEPGDIIHPGERVALTGINDPGTDRRPTPHLHLEVIPFDQKWRDLSDAQRATQKPGNTRINPVQFFTADFLKQITTATFDKDTLYYPPEHQRGKPAIQPTITPGGPTFWNP